MISKGIDATSEEGTREISQEKSITSQDLSKSNHSHSHSQSSRPSKKRTVDPKRLGDVPTPSEDNDSLPDLVDDSTIREKLEGVRGGRQWNIWEDTPGGHADDNFNIVEAIEFDEASGEFVPDESELLEEDDDIIEDQEEESIILQRARRRNSLPSDPRPADETLQGIHSKKSLSRFHPAFKDHERWKEAVTGYDPDNVESSSVSGNLAFQENLEKYALTPKEQVYGSIGNRATKTPATTKRSGGRRLREMPVPNLDGDSERSDCLSPGEAPVVSTPRSKCGVLQRPLSTRHTSPGLHQQPKGSSSTGRSSGRHSSTRPRKDRGRKGKRIPDVVPTIPGVEGVVRSPMSSSLTSTPNSHSLSLTSSIQTNEQQQALQVLRRHHGTRDSSPKRESNKSLVSHVGRGRDLSPAPDYDDYTLGASTITTNFSTTQRTTGENTVSTRSLFQSERLSVSENPKKPIRRRADSESEVDSTFYEETSQPPKQPLSSEKDFAALDDPFQTKLHLSDSEISHSEELRQVISDDDSVAPLNDVKRHSWNNSYNSSMWSANCSISTGGANSGSDGNSHTTPGSNSSRLQEAHSSSNSEGDEKEFDDNKAQCFSDGSFNLNAGVNRLKVGVKSASDLRQTEPLQKDQVTFKNQQIDKLCEKFDGHLVDTSNKTALLHAKKKKYGIFRRAKSWKGVVALRNEDED